MQRLAALLFTLLFCLLSLGTSLAEGRPLSDFVRHSDYLDVLISPDGKHFVARVRDDETVNLLIISLETGELVGGIKPPEDSYLGQVLWATNERIIYSFADKGSQVDSPGWTGELYAVNIDNSNNKLIAGYRASDEETGRRFSRKQEAWATHVVLNRLPDDDRHVLILEHPWTKNGRYYYDYRDHPPTVSRLDIFSGTKKGKELIPQQGANAYASDDGKVNFITWSNEEFDYRASYRADQDADWEDLSTAFGENFKTLSAEGVNKDGSKAYFYGRMGDADIATLYEMDLATKKVTRLFDNQVDLSSWQLDVNMEPTVGLSFPAKAEYHYAANKLSSNDVKLHKGLVKAFPGQVVTKQSETEDGSKVVLYVRSDTNPGEYYLYNTATKQADFLLANYSWLDPREMQAKQSIVVNARDGAEIPAYLTMPNSPSDALPPLIVLPHGGPHYSRDYPDFDTEVQLLANRGYAVLQVNFRGGGGYGKKNRELGYQNWDGVMIDDILDGTKQLISNKQVDGNRVCVYGASYGGYAAMMAAIKEPDLFQCAVGYVGVYDLTAQYELGDIPERFGGKGYLERILGTDKERLKQQSPVFNADKIKAKVMLIHGEEDRRVPIYHGKEMRKALKKAGNEPEWVFLATASHGAWSVKNRTKVYSELTDFFEDHLGEN